MRKGKYTVNKPLIGGVTSRVFRITMSEKYYRTYLEILKEAAANYKYKPKYWYRTIIEQCPLCGEETIISKYRVYNENLKGRFYITKENCSCRINV